MLDVKSCSTLRFILIICPLCRDDLKKENKLLKEVKNQHVAVIDALENANAIQKQEIDRLKERLTESNVELMNLEKELQSIFTKGQILKLKKGFKRRVWTEEDIAESIPLYSASPKLYKLLYRKKFPLPSVRTLQRWANKIDCSRGILKPVFKILAASAELNELDKLCVLFFDEMKVRKTYCYDKSSDTTLPPVSYVQVAMLRGD